MTYVQTTTIERYSISLGAALAITAVLFFVMQAAIAGGEILEGERKYLSTVGMLPKLPEEPVEVRDRTVPKPPPVEDMPEPPIMQRTFDSVGGGSPFVVPEPKPEVGPITGGSGASEGDLLPIIRVAPEYPQRAASRGMEGWVIVEFVVDELGRVLDPRVIDASPFGVFDRAALKAVLRYKYKPRVLNGVPQVVNGVRQRIVFNLNS